MGRTFESVTHGILKMAIQQGRSERRAEAYPWGYVEALNVATCLREAASAKAGNDDGGLFQYPVRRGEHENRF